MIILKSLKSGSIAQNEQQTTATDIKKNLLIVESYYKKTHNCEIGSSLKLFLNYIVSIHENDVNGKERYSEYRALIKDIENRCGSN